MFENHSRIGVCLLYEIAQGQIFLSLIFLRSGSCLSRSSEDQVHGYKLDRFVVSVLYCGSSFRPSSQRIVFKLVVEIWIYNAVKLRQDPGNLDRMRNKGLFL